MKTGIICQGDRYNYKHLYLQLGYPHFSLLLILIAKCNNNKIFHTVPTNETLLQETINILSKGSSEQKVRTKSSINYFLIKHNSFRRHDVIWCHRRVRLQNLYICTVNFTCTGGPQPWMGQNVQVLIFSSVSIYSQLHLALIVTLI